MMTAAAGILLVLLCLAVGYGIYERRKTYRRIDRLLDSVLNQEMITSSDVQEGEFSALVSKIMQIQNVLGAQVERADEEKAQVKQLVSDMSHQLKTPLASLSVCAELLSRDDLSRERRREFEEKMHRQIERLTWIVDSLSRMVRLEQNIDRIETDALSIRQTLLDAVDTVYGKMEKKEIRFSLEPFEDICLRHNRKWTAEVFANLLENAVKYTEKGGTVTIRVHPYEIYTEIQVIDSGMGIRPEETTEIFRRFYRGKDAEMTEGSGIGLYLSSLILEKESGYITVRSQYGKGSCFSVFLQNCKK